MANRSARGISLIQVMSAVVVIAALAAGLGVWNARRRAVKLRMLTEVRTVFEALRSGLEAHRRSHGSYLPKEQRPANDATFWPSSEPDDEPDPWDAPGRYAYLTALGIPSQGDVTCRYAVLMGDPGDGTATWNGLDTCTSPPCAGAAAEIFGTPTIPIEPWYYLRAQCNLEAREGGEASWYEWRARMDTPHLWFVAPAR